MSPRGWIRRQLKRPIAGHERTTATACGLLLLLAAAGLILTSPSRPAVDSSRRAHPIPASATAHGEARSRWTPAVAADAKATAETFLHGYLAYLYGRAAASRIEDASTGFARSLEHARPQVPPGIKALHPRVVSVNVFPQAPGDALATALVSDAEVVHYPIRLELTESAHGWQVSGLEGSP